MATSWNGDTIADFLKRLIATMGRPAAYLKDNGSDLHKAVDLLDAQSLGSPCIDDISHAAAGMLKRTYQHHPAFESFLSACGRVSGKLKQTLLACLARTHRAHQGPLHECPPLSRLGRPRAPAVATGRGQTGLDVSQAAQRSG